MSVFFKYKIELAEAKCLEMYEGKYGIKIPQELKSFIIQNNGAMPSADCIKINGVERVVDSILSFNEQEDDAVTFCEVYETIGKTNIIPFAADPFGNFYYCTIDGIIGFYEHEEQEYIDTDYSLSSFVSSLY